MKRQERPQEALEEDVRRRRFEHTTRPGTPGLERVARNAAATTETDLWDGQ